jgi:succinate dehydrogenase/fumarate reductase flavoprotein subunit
LEKYRGLVAHGAHIASVGSRIQKENGVIIDKKQFARDWMRICGSRVDEDLLWLFINRSEEAFEWLLECGGGHVDAVLFGGNYRGPDFTEYAGTHFLINKKDGKYRHSGALLICEIMEDVATSGGAEIRRRTRALQLEKTNGRVTAVLARGEDGLLGLFRRVESGLPERPHQPARPSFLERRRQERWPSHRKKTTCSS